MNTQRVSVFCELAALYQPAKSILFAQKISTLLMFSVSTPAATWTLTSMASTNREPWPRNQTATNSDLTEGASVDPSCNRRGRLNQGPTEAGRHHVGQLAHDQKVLGTHGLLRERHSHENSGRHLARRESMEKSTRWQGIDQC